MQSLASIIADEIQRQGPMPFSRFMELALYHPSLGYYRRRRDPFGRMGDFYTAEQLQPVFGRLIAAYLDRLAPHFAPGPLAVVEMGAGRREMAQAFERFRYIPIDIDGGEMPERFEGVVFSNEFFDALPVDLLVRREDRWFHRRVTMREGRFCWDDAEPCASLMPDAFGDAEVLELQDARAAALRAIAARLERGFVITIDYGYTRRELVRFPQGTLMSYRRHTAFEDVLAAPGDGDITAHVDFSCLQDEGERLGLRTESFESLAAVLLSAGEADGFASALAGEDEAEMARHRLQLKSLLFGMGETFRVLVQSRGVSGQ